MRAGRVPLRSRCQIVTVCCAITTCVEVLTHRQSFKVSCSHEYRRHGGGRHRSRSRDTNALIASFWRNAFVCCGGGDRVAAGGTLVMDHLAEQPVAFAQVLRRSPSTTRSSRLIPLASLAVALTVTEPLLGSLAPFAGLVMATVGGVDNGKRPSPG